MDLSTITPQDFKDLFEYDFPYLIIYDPAELYNKGARVYYPTTKLFYDCLADGTTGISPTDATKWEKVEDSVENYVSDSQIARAMLEAMIVFNQALFDTDDNIKMGFLYLTAFYLVQDIRAMMGGINGNSGVGIMTSRSAGSVSESYGIPQAYMDDPAYAFLTSNPYGMKYLSLIWAKLRGNMFVVFGRTLP